MISHPPVKINLGLEILRKREDGYHDLDTVFLPYPGISDTLEIVRGEEWSETSKRLSALYSTDEGTLRQEISPDGKLMITVARAEGVDWDPLSDLCAKAYALLCEDFTLGPVKIYLEKTSPVGAGLGGGSSDGAYTIAMLSDLYSLGLSAERKASYAARLGSDCPFFVYGSPMRGEGRGEILSPFSDPGIDCTKDGNDSSKPYLLKVVVPEGVSVKTSEAYRGVVPREQDGRGDDLMEALSLPIEKWRGRVENDFEKTVFPAHKELQAIKDSLYESGALYASMSGSGSALFAIYRK